MVWEFQCPVDGCSYSTTANKEGHVIENAQQHMRDRHGDMPTRADVEALVVGPG